MAANSAIFMALCRWALHGSSVYTLLKLSPCHPSQAMNDEPLAAAGVG